MMFAATVDTTSAAFTDTVTATPLLISAPGCQGAEVPAPVGAGGAAEGRLARR